MTRIVGHRALCLATSALARGVVLLAIAWAVPPSGAATRLPAAFHDPRDGKVVEVRAGGTVVHVAFFATWCPPCLEELDRLADLEARWAGRGYRLVLVALETRQTAARVAKFIVDRQPPGEVLFDVGGRVEKAWEVGQVPTHVILDASGTEVLRSGALDQSLVERLESLMAGRERKP